MQIQEVQDGNLDLNRRMESSHSSHYDHCQVLCFKLDEMQGTKEKPERAAEINPKKLLHLDQNVSIV